MQEGLLFPRYRQAGHPGQRGTGAKPAWGLAFLRSGHAKILLDKTIELSSVYVPRRETLGEPGVAAQSVHPPIAPACPALPGCGALPAGPAHSCLRRAGQRPYYAGQYRAISTPACRNRKVMNLILVPASRPQKMSRTGFHGKMVECNENSHYHVRVAIYQRRIPCRCSPSQ